MGVTESPVDVFVGLPAIFRESVSEDVGGRFRTERPFVIDGFVYATDGRIAVRVPVQTVPSIMPEWSDEDRKLPRDITGIFEKAIKGTGPPSALPDGIAGTVSCKLCKRAGTVECEFGYEHPCSSCDGKGESEDHNPASIGPRKFSRFYLALLYKHGVTTIRLPSSQEKPGVFNAEPSVEGLLMPMRDKATFQD